MATQIPIKAVTLYSIFISPAFRRGYKSVFAGDTFDPPLFTNDAWNYERGRLFATVLKAEGVGVLPIEVPKRHGVRGKTPATLYRALPSYSHFERAWFMGDII